MAEKPVDPRFAKPHRCEATIANIDTVIAAVTSFHASIRQSQERWDAGG